MKSSKLEKLLLEDKLLFQEQHVSLIVEMGSAHCPPQNNKHVYLVELSDGVTWMLAFFLEDSSTMDTLPSNQSLLTALQDEMITGIHILSARVCVCRRDNTLYPILYISNCRPIYNGHTSAMSRQVEEVRNRPDIQDWLTKLGQGTMAQFLDMSTQDEFWNVYIERVEPYLEQFISTMTAATWTATKPSNNDSIDERPAGTPIPSTSLLIQPSPPPMASSSTLAPYFPPTTTWENIQQLVRDTFDNDGNGLYMDGFIPIPHAIWEKDDHTTIKKENIDTGTHVSSVNVQKADDWYQLFLDVTGETTEYGRRKKLNAAKMEWTMTDIIMTLD